MSRFISVLLAVGLLLSCPAVSSYSSEVKKIEEKSFKIRPGGHIAIEGDEGFIKINSWDKAEVNLIMTKRAWGRSQEDAEQNLKKIEVSINEYDNRLDIRLVKERDRKNYSFWDLFDRDAWSERRSPTIDFELTVPKEINLNLVNDEGDVFVKSIIGDVEIRADEGDIEISDVAFNELNISVDEGDIDGFDLKNPDGRLTIEVDEGDVLFENVNVRRLKVECDEGDITIKKLSCNSGTITTDEGDIELDVALNENDRYRVSSDEGDVSVYLPTNPDVKLDLEAEDGGIRSDFNVSISKKDDRRVCRDTIGNGNALIEVYTDEGTIYLKRR
jgi:DUF4097 and DUF4098 domain-containing protein YvlB